MAMHKSLFDLSIEETTSTEMPHTVKFSNETGTGSMIICPLFLGAELYYNDTVIGTKGVYLSGGEQQRIAIARAMLKNAPSLILDEATAFADPDNEAKVQAAFAQLAKGKTVLMIAHRLSTVANADCIYVVQDGQIVESGTKDELCEQNGLFARMWQEYQASVQWKVAKEG